MRDLLLNVKVMSRILIIDDDPDIRTVLNILLRKNGYEVETAARKEEVFGMIQLFDPSLILLDVLLSGHDGRKICMDIKADPVTNHIPVIMFSAHPGAAGKIESYGADDFIAKPVNSETLLGKLGQYLKK
jgi:DNA-binding response OmpR family regulator